MSEDLEARLRNVLRPVPPSEEFSARLQERLAAAPRPQDAVQSYRARRPAAALWVGAALAASLLVAVGIVHRASEARERLAGRAARQQVLDALRVTNQKVDLAYLTVTSESRDEL
jgi:hypothetical protein